MWHMPTLKPCSCGLQFSFTFLHDLFAILQPYPLNGAAKMIFNKLRNILVDIFLLFVFIYGVFFIRESTYHYIASCNDFK